YQQHNSYPPTF
nr:immunoglobulin light chain junction region [Macaca mulatta]